MWSLEYLKAWEVPKRAVLGQHGRLGDAAAVVALCLSNGNRCCTHPATGVGNCFKHNRTLDDNNIIIQSFVDVIDAIVVVLVDDDVVVILVNPPMLLFVVKGKGEEGRK